MPPFSWPEQTGRTALVTGATSGLGLETALALSLAGARVLLAARDPDRGQRALQRVRDEGGAGAGTAELVRLDLADLDSVVEAAGEVLGRVDALDLLVNNAGVMAPDRGRTAQGFETQIGVNHLGHFALTGRLLPLLRAAGAARVVTVSSNAHRQGGFDLDDLSWQRRPYRRWAAYSASKLANLLFTLELARRAELAGVGLRAVAAHPGFAATNLVPAGPMAGLPEPLRELGRRLAELAGQSAEAGAAPVVYAATMPDVRSGDYYGPAGPGGWRGRPTRVTRSAAAQDPTTARLLWDLSERLTEVSFGLPAGTGRA